MFACLGANLEVAHLSISRPGVCNGRTCANHRIGERAFGSRGHGVGSKNGVDCVVPPAIDVQLPFAVTRRKRLRRVRKVGDVYLLATKESSADVRYCVMFWELYVTVLLPSDLRAAMG